MIKITYNELKDILNKNNIPIKDIAIADNEYNIPKKEWILTTYKNGFFKFLEYLEVHKYKASWDCDDFSRMYAAYGQILHARTTKKKFEGIAIGEIWYKIDNTENHAINIAILENKDVIFIEPQSGEELKLSKTKKSSIYFIRF